MSRQATKGDLVAVVNALSMGTNPQRLSRLSVLELRRLALSRAGELVERLAELERRSAALGEALRWCGGSPDFQEGGQAREGWERVVAPLLGGGA